MHVHHASRKKKAHRKLASMNSSTLLRAALHQISKGADASPLEGEPSNAEISVVNAPETPNEGFELCPPSTDAEEANLTSFRPSFPSFKRIPSTRFIVDGFRYAGPWSTSYFLSHFHSDHYTGLTSSWNKGVIFCSEITARLVTECIQVPPPFVYSLPMGEPVEIDLCLVTLVEANHCPGAVQFLFQVPTQERNTFMRFVHTGDMRYSSDMNVNPSLCDFVGANAVFLDTTYCNPKFVFPSQSESVDYVAETIFAMRNGSCEEMEGLVFSYDGFEDVEEQPMGVQNNPHQMEECSKDSEDDTARTEKRDMGNVMPLLNLPQHKTRTLFLISTYVIGKEKILLAVAKRCNCLIYVNEKKLSILKCLNLEDLDVFTTIPSATNVHVVSWNFLGETWPFFRPNFKRMEELLKKSHCHRVVGFVPTGWTYETKKKTFSVRRKGPLEIHLVPYSEHSNYEELRQYVAFLRPQEIIPTVGLEGGDMDSKAVVAMRKHFRNLVDETASKRRFLKGFSRKGLNGGSLEKENKQPSLVIKSEIATLDMGLLDDGKDADEMQHPNMDPHQGPRAAFGKGAKKRQRESIDLDQPGATCSRLAKREKPCAKEGSSASAVQIISSKDVGMDETTTSPGSEAKKEQLRTILPAEVSEQQLHDLLLKANGQLDVAASMFFEGCLVIMKDKQYEKAGEQCLCGQTADADPCIKAGTEALDSQKELAKLVRVNANRKTPKSATVAMRRKSTGLQASILTFFRKSDSRSGNSQPSMVCKTLDVDLNNEDPSGKKLESCAAMDQLLTILGGAVSVEKAQSLLELSCGDVGVALDLFYKEGGPSCAELDNNMANNIAIASSTSQCVNESKVSQPAEGNGGKRLQTGLGHTHQDLCPSTRTILEANDLSVAIPIWYYKPVENACWCSGEPAPYLHLARTFDLVEQESGRLKTSDMLCNMFRSLLALSPEAVLPTVYLATNRIAPDYENVDLNIGGSIVSAAIVEATGTQKSKLREMHNNMGDLGDVAQACRQTQSLLVAPRTLSIARVFSTLLEISKESGSGSSSRKKSLILSLLRACREKEMKYIVRTLVQNMRIGAMMRSVLPALAQAIVLHSSSWDGKNEGLKSELQRASVAIVEAYNFMPNLNVLVPALLQKGIKMVVSNISVSPGIPMKPMLAKITNGILDIFKRFQGKPFTCEYKYDGQRAQIHLIKDGSIKIFSRNCEDTTSRFPDVLEIVRMALKPGIQDIIFDAEIVAVDRVNNNKLMTFQHLSTRERGRNGEAVNLEKIKVDVCLFVFDLMYANGTPLVKMPFRKRRERMHECFEEGLPGHFGFASQVTIEAHESNLESQMNLMKVESFLEEAINASCEGMMVKVLDEESAYAPSKRSDSWLKVKRDYVEGLHDTLDLVPIGAWHGNGRKAGWYSPFLLACYDTEREEFQSVCRVMSGFTDAFYKQMKEFFSAERVLKRKPTYYQTLEEPDMWFTPELVWEIRGADLTVSPVHQSAVGLVHPSRGISLRFPRFIKERRDKKPEDASSPSEIADLFHQQSRKFDLPVHAHGHSHGPEDGEFSS